ncbi:MAG: hypothetical protein H0W08_11200 [Acidobacteria bacterium]|nr:hypothetical protein [Acidobacteriota bacterium]
MTTRPMRRVDIWLFGAGNFPIAKISLPEALVTDLESHVPSLLQTTA